MYTALSQYKEHIQLSYSYYFGQIVNQVYLYYLFETKNENLICINVYGFYFNVRFIENPYLCYGNQKPIFSSKMSLGVIILLIVLGIVLMVLEILVVPGGILGIVALGMIGGGVYGVYDSYGSTSGHIALAISTVATISAVYISLKSNTWNKLALHDELKGNVNSGNTYTPAIGDKGMAISDLRPMGTALFNDEKVEVSSEGEKIPVHTPIIILRVEGNKVFVQKTDK